MAGGQGIRLRPLTCHIPKPMVPLLGRPVLQHVMAHLQQEGFSQLAITSFFQPQVIQDFFGDGERFGVDIHYSVEKTPRGTAGSIQELQSVLTDTFLVISGDAVSSLPLQRALAFHREKKALITLLLKKVTHPLEYGVVMTDDEGRITRFLEKPTWGQVFSDTVNTGIYILEPQVLDWIPQGEQMDFSQDLFPRLLEAGAGLFGYTADGYWSDIGTLEEYRRAHQDLLALPWGINGGNIQVQEGGIYLEEPVDISPSASLEGPLYMGPGTCIQEGAVLSSSVIGSGCCIEQGAQVQDSILWDGVHMGAYSQMTGAVVGDHVLLGEQVVLEEGSVLGSRVQVGEYAHIHWGVKVWPGRKVQRTATLSRHLVKSPFYPHSLFGEHGACGRANLDLTPEVSSLLGSSFGSLLPLPSTLLVTTDHHPISYLNGKALQMGLLSTGNHVLEGGDVILPVLRHAIRALELAGGVHVHLHPHRSQELILEFFDSKGQNLSPTKERELERIYHQGRLRRASQEELGRSLVGEGLEQEYLQGLVDGSGLEGGLRFLACHDENSSAQLLECLITGMGGEFLSSGEKPTQLEISRFQQEIQEVEADVGLILYPNGEELLLFTHTGHLLEGDNFQVLLAILLKEQGLLPLVFPVTAPRIIEDLVGEGEVIRTGSHHHQVLSTFFALHGEKTPYSPFQDGLVTLAWLTELLLQEGISFAELCYSIPSFYRIQEQVPCPQEEKGRILRNLVEKRQEEPSFTEGVHFSHPGGSALILPHGEDPLFHIYAEASSLEEAGELARDYRELINGLL